MIRCLALTVVALLGAAAPAAAAGSSSGPWVTVWTASAQGPYPSGYPSAQPNLTFAFPDAAAGAHDQTFRAIVRPDVWGSRARIRLSNAFGTRPITFDGVFAGERALGGNVVPGTNEPVRFGGNSSVTVAPGSSVWSDAVDLPFVAAIPAAQRDGRFLAVSYHVVGDTGPMTWHAKALTTSYVTPPGTGAHGDSASDTPFTYATASWFFVDAVDMAPPAPNTKVIVAFGDSITDGTDSTMNGDDRWPDRFSQRLHAQVGDQATIVNEGIGGNRIVGPRDYSAAKPFAGGPAAVQRLSRDVIELSGVSTVVLFEGINDFGRSGEGATPAAVEGGYTSMVRRLRRAIPGVRIVGATLTTALGSTNKDHGSAEEDASRRSFNAWMRGSRLFDAVIDFDAVTLDPATGRMKPQFVPDNTVGGPGDGLHPNRAGYGAMADSIDIHTLLP